MEVIARLTIFSKEYTPDQISEILNIFPDEIILMNEIRVKGTNLKWEKNYWTINSKIDKNLSLSEHIDDLISKIKPSLDRFMLLVDKCGLEISCEIMADSNPEIHFTSEQLKIFSTINAELDIDLYIA